MAQFAYTGRKGGQKLSGSLEAASAAQAAARLAEDGIVPLSIAEQAAETAGAGFDLKAALASRKPALPELIMFSRQMYTLNKAGVPILRAFAGLAESTTNPRFAEVLRQIAQDLQTGQDLATALSNHPKVFSEFYVSMVHVGENTGRLDQAFLQLSGHLEREQETRKRIAAALRYPSFVVIAIAAAIAVINVMVIPAFATIFKSFKSELPWATRVLLATSDFFVNHWLLLILGIAASIAGWIWWTGTPTGRLWWDRKKLSLPIVGNIIHRALLSRFAHSFATLARAGVPLPTGLSVVGRVVDNAYVAGKLREMREGIERGESIVRNAANTGMFSALVLQMLAVGEETGALDELLEEVAEFYDREVDYDLKRMSDLIEPIMILAVGGLVLILALGVFLPMWELTSLARGGR
ncbi:MAG: type II secretion system F family protein [Gammaproteobacteria bacterium]|nr:type II secretion system F family protein [Gammaproteobacteria bacterium]